MSTDAEIDKLVRREYSAGFTTSVESETLPPGLDEGVIRHISARKGEPEWLLEWRLEAYRKWLTMTPPEWAHIHHPPIDFNEVSYFSAPKSMADRPKSLDEVDPELLRTYEKLGIPLHEQATLAGVAVDAVFDSVSIGTTFRGKLKEAGVIFCSISEAVHEYPDLIKDHLGSVVPQGDNFYAALNSAVFSDGSFVYIPKGVKCPMELSTYFRINEAKTGQFERTLIVADEGSQVSYLEGCTAPMRDENQLHAAVVELVARKDAKIKYSTVQNWYPGDEEGRGGIYNFVTKRGVAHENAHISWTQVETGSAITWKYPSVILRGDNSVGEFYSVALTRGRQQADTGTKMIHLGKNTKSTIISKGISAGRSQNAYRGLVRISPRAEGARNFTQCDSLLIGDQCGAHTFPYIESRNPSATLEHEATTSKVSDDQLFLCRQRGIDTEKAVSMIVNGFCKEVFRELPMEFAVEAGKLLEVSLEGSGPNGSGKSTLSNVLAGRDGYQITSGEVLFEGKPVADMETEERARAGIFLAFQYPVEIPGVSNMEFLKASLEAVRSAQGKEPLDAVSLLRRAREACQQVNLDQQFLKRGVNEGFSGGEKKRNEIMQMMLLEPKLALLDETDSGLDIDALQVVAKGVNALRSPDRAIVLVTHYQRLLDYIVPDHVHVLAGGKIIKSGGKELALELEQKGYGWLTGEEESA